MSGKSTKALIVGVFLLVSATGTKGEDAPAPKSPEVKAAILKRDKTVEAARQTYARASIAADEQLVADLNSQLKAAMKNQNIKLVKETETACEQAKADLEAAKESLRSGAPPAAAKGAGGQAKVVVTVTATKPWQAFGEVKKGDNLFITAEGQWSHGTGLHGPEGKGLGFLEGRVGEKGTPFVIGAGVRYSVLQDGILYMQCHDTEYDNNAGEVTVTLEKK
jgi:hypothetical protein